MATTPSKPVDANTVFLHFVGSTLSRVNFDRLSPGDNRDLSSVSRTSPSVWRQSNAGEVVGMARALEAGLSGWTTGQLRRDQAGEHAKGRRHSISKLRALSSHLRQTAQGVATSVRRLSVDQEAGAPDSPELTSQVLGRNLVATELLRDLQKFEIAREAMVTYLTIFSPEGMKGLRSISPDIARQLEAGTLEAGFPDDRALD